MSVYEQDPDGRDVQYQEHLRRQQESAYYDYVEEQQARQFKVEYEAWKSDKLEDDPDTPEEELTEEAFSNYLVEKWEAIHDV